MISQRKEISIHSSILDTLILMSEGNPGAISVLKEILDAEKRGVGHGFLTILSLDDMNIRGTQIWIGYKDHCGQSIDAFIEAIFKRDAAMVETINSEGRKGNHKDQAVTGQASSPNRRELL